MKELPSLTLNFTRREWEVIHTGLCCAWALAEADKTHPGLAASFRKGGAGEFPTEEKAKKLAFYIDDALGPMLGGGKR